MTRQEAHRILACMAIDLTGALSGTKEPMLDVMRQRLGAINVAQTALRPVSREMVERMRGEWIKPHWKNSTSCAACSQCGFEAHHHEYHGVQDTYLFCPRCMAPMTDEAVEMVMKRWEAVKDGKGD